MYRYFLLPVVVACAPLHGVAQTTEQTTVAWSKNETTKSQRALMPAKRLTLSMALDAAMQNNPEISASRREIDANQGLLRQAGVIPNPELAYLVEDLKKEYRTTTVQINQTIELGGKRSARISAAERALDIANVGLQAKRIAIRSQVIAAFYAALSSQERYRLAQDSLTLAERATTIASKRVAAGKVSPLDETKARVAATGTRVELAQAASEMTIARSRLAAAMGEKQASFDAVDGSVDVLPMVPEWDVLASKLEQSPDIARARIEIERRRALVRVERAKRFSDLTLTIGNMRDEQLGRNQTIVGFSIPLPLFDRNQGNLQEALSRTGQAEDEFTATINRIESELNQAYQRLKVARQEAVLYQTEILPDANTAYIAATKGFEYGKFGFIDVLDAQRTLFQAKSQYLRALSEAHLASTDIDRLIGNVDTSNKWGNNE